MDFDESITALANRAKRLISHIKTEEATKQALVVPFLQVMGYDPSDPTEVVPEFVADFATKKGEKVDYAILRHGKPVIVIECKWSGINLDTIHAEQLYRYFSVSGARVGILTNGILYRFFTDLEKANQLDVRPFLEFNIYDAQEDTIAELRKLSKNKLNLEVLPTFAADLKYTREIKQHLAAQLIEPTDDFVKLFASMVYPGQLRQQVVAQFKTLTQKAFRQFVNDSVNQRLQAAMNNLDGQASETKKEPIIVPEVKDQIKKDKLVIVTTPEEIEAYELVKMIVSQTTDSSRVILRDAATYCAIILDDNNRKPIARLYFNNDQKKKIELFDKSEPEKIDIKNIVEINNISARLVATIAKYEQ